MKYQILESEVRYRGLSHVSSEVFEEAAFSPPFRYEAVTSCEQLNRTKEIRTPLQNYVTLLQT